MVRSLVAAISIAASLGFSTAAFAATPTDVRIPERGLSLLEFHGSIHGGAGVNLKCGAGGTTGQVKYADGSVKTDIPTTAGPNGSCDFVAPLTQGPSRSALTSSCAGRVSIAQMSEFPATQRTFANNAESFGKLGSKTITGGVTTLTPGTTSGVVTVTAQ